APDQLGQIRLLAHLTVHLQPDPAAAQMTALGSRRDGADRSGTIETLARIPRPAVVLSVRLQVAAGEVVADCVTVDMVECLRCGDVPSALADRHHQLDLVV